MSPGRRTSLPLLLAISTAGALPACYPGVWVRPDERCDNVTEAAAASWREAASHRARAADAYRFAMEERPYGDAAARCAVDYALLSAGVTTRARWADGLLEEDWFLVATSMTLAACDKLLACTAQAGSDQQASQQDIERQCEPHARRAASGATLPAVAAVAWGRLRGPALELEDITAGTGCDTWYVERAATAHGDEQVAALYRGAAEIAGISVSAPTRALAQAEQLQARAKQLNAQWAEAVADFDKELEMSRSAAKICRRDWIDGRQR